MFWSKNRSCSGSRGNRSCWRTRRNFGVVQPLQKNKGGDGDSQGPPSAKRRVSCAPGDLEFSLVRVVEGTSSWVPSPGQTSQAVLMCTRDKRLCWTCLLYSQGHCQRSEERPHHRACWPALVFAQESWHSQALAWWREYLNVAVPRVLSSVLYILFSTFEV